MARDDHQDIPSFAASRDEGMAAAPRGAPPRARPRNGNAGSSSGGGLFGRLVLTIAFVAAGVACGWAWQLQMALDETRVLLSQTSERVGNLELLLSDTDETLNQSSAKINEDLGFWKTEIRKLWDWRNKEAKPALDKLEAQIGSATTSIKRLRGVADANATSLKSVEREMAALKQLRSDLERMSASARSTQTDLERLADAANKARLDRAALTKKFDDHEEWLKSIDGFRRTVNSKINSLEQQVRAAKAAPSSPALQ